MEKPIQGGGPTRRWANPKNREVWRFFTRLDERCEPPQYPGVLILTDQQHKNSLLVRVKNLRKELAGLRAAHPGLEVGYWRVIANDKEGAEYLSQLSLTPLFDDRI